MFELHDQLTIKNFEGIHDRDDGDFIPHGFLKDALNVNFFEQEIRTREGLTADNEGTTAGLFGIVRWVGVHAGLGPNSYQIIYFDGTTIKDANTGVTLITPFDANATPSGLSAFGRYYLLLTGTLVNNNLYVWNPPIAGIRAAMGAAPSGATLASVDSGAGKIERGTHVFKVVYETDTGYVTAPGDTQFSAFVSTGARKCDLSGIPTGPAGTVKRHILVTRSLINWNNDTKNLEYFFLPNGTINDNVTTVLANVSFYDADLVDSADYTLSQLSSFNAYAFGYDGARGGVGVYRNRLVVWAIDKVFVSNPGEPESFDSVKGFISIDESKYGPVTDCAEIRGTLYIWTTKSTLATSDNGDDPASWEVIEIDPSKGAVDHGVAKIYSRAGNTIDFVFVENASGVFRFSGVYEQELTFPIFRTWQKNVYARYNTSEQFVPMMVDPYKKRIYVFYKTDTVLTSTNYVLVGEYSRGMDRIRWGFWKFDTDHATRPSYISWMFSYYEADEEPKVFFVLIKAGDNCQKYRLDETTKQDWGRAIPWHVEFEVDGETNKINQWNQVLLRVLGAGNMTTTVYWMDKVKNKVLPVLALSSAPGKEFIKKFNVVSSRFGIKFSGTALDSWISLRKIVNYSRALWNVFR